jgi:glutamate/tyrosine decarboxylase-like PLP-dependent enzyme
MIGDDMRLARAMATAVAATPELELVTQALSITTFRFVPADLRARAAEPRVAEHVDALNKRLLERIQSGGELFVSNAVIDGRYVLRACIVNMNTRLADVQAVPEIVVRLGREVDAGLRAETVGL